MTEFVCSDHDLILVVDDEEAIEEMVEELVEEHGCPHVSFNDPRKALEYYRENSPAVTVIITDSIMPSLSGADLVKEVRAIDPKVPIILVTNYEGEPVPDDVTRLVSFILPKPFTHAELLDVLKTALARARD
jgi:DNA-binding NtrC family response regulator